jgi:hypothetical protein
VTTRMPWDPSDVADWGEPPPLVRPDESPFTCPAGNCPFTSSYAAGNGNGHANSSGNGRVTSNGNGHANSNGNRKTSFWRRFL